MAFGNVFHFQKSRVIANQEEARNEKCFKPYLQLKNNDYVLHLQFQQKYGRHHQQTLKLLEDRYFLVHE